MVTPADAVVWYFLVAASLNPVAPHATTHGVQIKAGEGVRGETVCALMKQMNPTGVCARG